MKLLRQNWIGNETWIAAFQAVGLPQDREMAALVLAEANGQTSGAGLGVSSIGMVEGFKDPIKARQSHTGTS